MAITRRQGNARNSITSGTSIPVTLDAQPLSGNILIAVVGYRSTAGNEHVNSISQSGVTWNQNPEVYKQLNNGEGLVGIWFGVVGFGASSSITVTLAKNVYRVGAVNACENSGVC